MTTERETCNLIFNTSLDGKRVVRIPDPSPTLSVATVNTAASRFIAANPFDETIGSLVSLANAEKVVITRIVLI
jgi:hypothetical protein